MFAFRVPIPSVSGPARGRKMLTAAATAAVAFGAAAPAAQATYEVFSGSGVFYWWEVPYGSRAPVTSVSLNNLNQGSFGLGGSIECVWAQNATNLTPYPAMATVQYSQNYIQANNTVPPPYANDYAGQPACVSDNTISHPYGGTPNRRGISFKSNFYHQYHDVYAWTSAQIY